MTRVRIVATIPVGARPTGVAEGFSEIFVTNYDDDSVSVIDRNTNMVVRTVTVGSRPAGVTTDPMAGVFVANSGDGTVTVFRGDAPPVHLEFETFAGGPPHPVGVANHHFAARVFVINRNGGVATIHHNTLKATPFPSIPFFDGGDPFAGSARSPHGIAFRSDSFYVTNPDTDSISVFDTTSGSPRHRAVIPVGRRPVGVATDPEQPLAYVANSKSDTVSVISGDSMIATIDVGRRPFGVACGPNERVWVIHDDGMVSLIDALTNTVVATVEVGSRPEGVAVDPNTGRAYVANSGEGTVSVIEPIDG